MIGTIVSHHREVKKLGEIQREFPRHNDGETTCAVGARGRQGLQAGASSVAFRNFGDLCFGRGAFPSSQRASTYLTNQAPMRGNFEIGRILHLESEIRNF